MMHGRRITHLDVGGKAEEIERITRGINILHARISGWSGRGLSQRWHKRGGGEWGGEYPTKNPRIQLNKARQSTRMTQNKYRKR